MALIHTPLLGIAAFSGTGKTTLLRRIIPALKTPMGPVGLIKHTHHRFEVDWPGKDSHRLARAGAAQTLVASPLRRAVISHYPTAQPAALEDHLATLDDGSLGLILVEGYKRKPLPKLELHRPSLGHPLLAHDDPSVVAIACDAPLEAPPVEVLDLNDPEAIVDFIARVIALQRPLLPATPADLAAAVRTGLAVDR